MADEGRIHIVIDGDASELKKALADVKSSLGEAGNESKKLDKSISTSVGSMGKNLASIAGRYISLAAAIGLVARTIRNTIDVNKQFERKTSELASILGTTKDGMDKLTSAAKELGRTTEFTSSEVVDLQMALARLGFTQGQILDMEGPVLKFAAAVNADLGRASNFAGAALRGFGLEAKDTEHLLDVMAAATTKSALDFSKLETSMSIVAPVAHAFGLSVEDTVTLLGSLSNAGFDASSAATATRNILLNLADANGKLAKGLGHTAKTFPEIISSLKECAAKGIDLNSTLEMTDKRSVAAFNALITGAASADELREALGNVDGTLNEMYETMTDNLAGAIKQLQSAWEGLLLTMQNSTGPMANVVKRLARGINVLTDLAEGKSLDQARQKQMGEAIIATGQFKTVEDYDNEINRLLYKEGGARGKELKYLEGLRYARMQTYIKEQDEAIESMFAEDANGVNGEGSGSLSDADKKALKRYKEAYDKVVTQLWKETSNSEIDAMREGTAKKLAQIENERIQTLAQIEDDRKEIEKNAKGAGLQVSSEVYEQLESRRLNAEKVALSKRSEVLEEQKKSQWDYLISYGNAKEKELAITQKYDYAIEKEDDEFKKKQLQREKDAALGELNATRLDYLEKYGTYKERELAITERYDRQINEASDEYQKATLRREKDAALRKLEQTYDSNYSLIFSNAESLSAPILKKAIDATQDAIKKAKDSGDIQALTELYERLREQMNVQGERNRGWGWSSISEGFALRESANGKRTSADVLEQLLVSEEDALEVLKDMGLSPEDIEASRDDIEQLRAEIQRLRDEADNDDSNALSFLQKGFTEVGKAMGELGSAMSSFRDNLGGACDTIADIGDGLSAMSSQIDSISEAFSGTMSKGDAWSTAISGAIQLMSMVGQSIANNKKAQDEWNDTIEQSAQKLLMLRLNALDYKQQNIFGVENPFKKAIDGATQYAAAMADLQNQTSVLLGGKVQTGTAKAIDWKNVGRGAGIGAASGAALGSVIPGIGTAIGAAVGGAIGLIAGLVSRKTVPVFESLSSKYGELFNPDTYELNEKLLADYDKLDDATKQIIDNWQEIAEKAKEAEEQMRENFSNLAGDVGSQLSDSLVEAFRNGDLYSAIDDFHGKMTSTIEDILEQLVFSSTMGAMFDQLEDRMMKSFGVNGDQNIVDDLIWMEQEYKKQLGQYNDAMLQVQQSLSDLGYDAWKADEVGRQAATKASIGASQDSVDESNARLTTMQGHTYELNESVKEIKIQHAQLITNTARLLEHVQGIHVDTSDMRATMSELRTIASTIKSGVSTIVDTGVRIR